MSVDKNVRWENVNLRAAGLSKSDLVEVVSILKSRLQLADAMVLPRLRKALKLANALINAPKPKGRKTEQPTTFYSGESPVGRFNGGMGAASFVSGGAPSSKR